MQRRLIHLMAALVAAALSACGGGNAESPSPTQPPESPVAAAKSYRCSAPEIRVTMVPDRSQAFDLDCVANKPARIVSRRVSPLSAPGGENAASPRSAWLGLSSITTAALPGEFGDYTGRISIELEENGATSWVHVPVTLTLVKEGGLPEEGTPPQECVNADIRVYDEETGKGVAGAQVTVAQRTAVTNSDGKAEIRKAMHNLDQAITITADQFETTVRHSQLPCGQLNSVGVTISKARKGA